MDLFYYAILVVSFCIAVYGLFTFLFPSRGLFFIRDEARRRRLRWMRSVVFFACIGLSGLINYSISKWHYAEFMEDDATRKEEQPKNDSIGHQKFRQQLLEDMAKLHN